MYTASHDVRGAEGQAFRIGEQVAARIGSIAICDPISKVLFKKLGHVERSCAVVALRSRLLPSLVVQSGVDVDLLPVKVHVGCF
jgi:hypothetical protein